MPNTNVTNLETLEEIIGRKLFFEVIEKMPGAIFRLPNNGEHYNKQQRNKRIIEDFYRGMNVSELMKKYQLKKSTIYKIIEKP